MSSGIDWNDTIKKEARGNNDEDLGEVQEVTNDYVLVQRGLVNKEKFYIPQDQTDSYDGSVLRFRVSEEEILNKYMTDSPPQSSLQQQSSSSTLPEMTLVTIVESNKQQKIENQKKQKYP